MRRIVASPKAPKAIGPYSQGVVTHHADGIRMLHAAGQIPIDPATGELVSGDAAAQAERVLENVSHVLAEAGMDFGHVVKTTVFLVDLADFAAMNEVYSRFFQGEYPARSTVQVAALPKGARVEIEVQAVHHGAARRSAPRKARRPAAKARKTPSKARKTAAKPRKTPRGSRNRR
jgi:2-iminobutanoate/2-iminopropanoate deaminase